MKKIIIYLIFIIAVSTLQTACGGSTYGEFEEFLEVPSRDAVIKFSATDKSYYIFTKSLDNSYRLTRFPVLDILERDNVLYVYTPDRFLILKKSKDNNIKVATLMTDVIRVDINKIDSWLETSLSRKDPNFAPANKYSGDTKIFNSLIKVRDNLNGVWIDYNDPKVKIFNINLNKYDCAFLDPVISQLYGSNETSIISYVIQEYENGYKSAEISLFKKDIDFKGSGQIVIPEYKKNPWISDFVFNIPDSFETKYVSIIPEMSESEMKKREKEANEQQ